MKTTRIGIALLVLLGSVPVRAEDPVATLPLEPPGIYSPLVWKGPELTARGFWYAEEQTSKIDRRIEFLEKKAAKECVDAQIEAAKSIKPWIKVAAGIVTGAAIGFCVAHGSHCGLSK